MSIGITEKQVLYDNPCAPIVKFSHIDEFDDMMDDQTSSSNIILDTLLQPTLGQYIKKNFDKLIRIFYFNRKFIQSTFT